MAEYVQCNNCDRPAKYRGLKLCARCYQRYRSTGDPNGVKIREKTYCAMPDCDRQSKAWGWCEKHWQRIERWGDPSDGRKWQRDHPESCAVPGCGGRHRAMGLCERHYGQESKRGHPIWKTPGRRKVHDDRPWTEETVRDYSRLLEATITQRIIHMPVT